MKYKIGDRVLVSTNAYNMKLSAKWPLKASIHAPAKCNLPNPSISELLDEYYFVVFSADNPREVTMDLDRQDYYGNRWVYPGKLLKRDAYCSVCGQFVRTLQKEMTLIAEHTIQHTTEICYGSYSPLDL